MNLYIFLKCPSLDLISTNFSQFLCHWLLHTAATFVCVYDQWPRNDTLINWHIMSLSTQFLTWMFIYFHFPLFPGLHLEYTCHGSWLENQTTTFIIARHSKYLVCISFKQLTTDTAQLFIGDSCYRGQQGAPLDESAERLYSVANLTNVGRK